MNGYAAPAGTAERYRRLCQASCPSMRALPGSARNGSHDHACSSLLGAIIIARATEDSAN